MSDWAADKAKELLTTMRGMDEVDAALFLSGALRGVRDAERFRLAKETPTATVEIPPGFRKHALRVHVGGISWWMDLPDAIALLRSGEGGVMDGQDAQVSEASPASAGQAMPQVRTQHKAQTPPVVGPNGSGPFQEAKEHQMNWTYKIGDAVCNAYGHSQHDRWIGHVVAREWYSNAMGEGEYVYVRWTKPDGELHNDNVRLHVTEVKIP